MNLDLKIVSNLKQEFHFELVYQVASLGAVSKIFRHTQLQKKYIEKYGKGKNYFEVCEVDTRV